MLVVVVSSSLTTAGDGEGEGQATELDAGPIAGLSVLLILPPVTDDEDDMVFGMNLISAVTCGRGER